MKWNNRQCVSRQMNWRNWWKLWPIYTEHHYRCYEGLGIYVPRYTFHFGPYREWGFV